MGPNQAKTHTNPLLLNDDSVSPAFLAIQSCHVSPPGLSRCDLTSLHFLRSHFYIYPFGALTFITSNYLIATRDSAYFSTFPLPFSPLAISFFQASPDLYSCFPFFLLLSTFSCHLRLMIFGTEKFLIMTVMSSGLPCPLHLSLARARAR